jgi:hypothetical protein
MSDWYAFHYPVAAGTEERVKDLFRRSQWPASGLLLSTIGFVGHQKAFLVIETGQPLPLTAGRLNGLDEVRAFERELEPCLIAPQPVFPVDAAMPCAASMGAVPDEEWPTSNWQALFYPLKPGTEELVGQLFAGTGSPDLDVLDEDGNKVGRLLRTMAFIANAEALRVNQIEGTIEAVAAHMSRQPSAHAFQLELDQYLAVSRDMGDLLAARSFFLTAIMECVLARHTPGDDS